MDQIFNELSANGSYANSVDASNGMERCLRLSRDMPNYGLTEIIRTTRDFAQRELSADYTVHKWAADKNAPCTHEVRQYYLTKATKHRYIESFIDEHEKSEGSYIEFRINGEPALGLGLANIWGSFALSLDGDPAFQVDDVLLECSELTSDGEERQSIATAASLWESGQVGEYGARLRTQARIAVKTGDDLIEQSTRLFPRLSFTGNAVEQLKLLVGSEQHFPEVVRHLSILDDTMERWTGGPFKPAGITYSGESKSTLGQYGSLREFECKDGQIRIFKMHTKIMSFNKRIHYFPIPTSKIVHIGYVGRHLPTTRAPH